MSEVAQTTQQQTTQQTAEYKFEFTDPEVKEAFPKMFPGMKSVEDLAKTAIHQQRKIGQQGVPIPQKPEEVVPFLQTHFKAPKEGKEYKFDKLKVPEGFPVDKVALQGFAENFAKIGLTQQQAEPLLEAFYAHAHGEQQKVNAKMEQTKTESTLALQKEWGTEFDTKIRNAQRAVELLGGQEAVKLIAESGLGNHAPLVKLFAKAAELMKEDPISGKMSSGGFAAGPQQAAQEIDMLMADETFRKDYFNEHSPGFQSARDRMRNLYAIKHGEKGKK